MSEEPSEDTMDGTTNLKHTEDEKPYLVSRVLNTVNFPPKVFDGASAMVLLSTHEAAPKNASVHFIVRITATVAQPSHSSPVRFRTAPLC